MIRYETKQSKVLFIGINPHPGSFERGVPFSNNKMFWYLLQRAGILKESIEDLKDDAALKKMYRFKFNKVYGLGFVNIIARPTVNITFLQKGEELEGRKRIEKLIRVMRPEVVCFVGKITYAKYIGSTDLDFGWQDPIHASKVFVMHSPLRGEAIVRIRELKLVAKTAFKK